MDSEYVTFDLAGEPYAFPMSRVREIIRRPATVVRVPLGPPALEGLANLRGRVLPVVSLRLCCALPPAEHDEATRVIVVDGGVPLGVVVDRVSGVINVDPASIEPADAKGPADALVGVLRSGDRGMITVLDVDRLLGAEFDREKADGGGLPPQLVTESEADERDDTLELISFSVAGQEYALPIDQVREIVQAPESVSHVPNAGDRLLGMIDLRGRPLPVVSMRRVLGLPVHDLGPRNRIVVVSLDDGPLGVVMDTVREVLRVPRQLVAPLPGFMAAGRATEVESVCRLEDGKRLVSVLSAQQIFNSPEVRVGTAGHHDDREVPDMQDEDQFVVFRLDGEEYAVDVDAVQEIIRVPATLVRVPKSFDFVEGLVNLRGSALPVVDLRARLGLAHAGRDERQRIVVLIIGGVRTGFIVDSVAEVARVGRDVPEPAPRLSDGQARVVSRVANLPDQRRMLLLIEPERLLAADQARVVEDATTPAGV